MIVVLIFIEKLPPTPGYEPLLWPLNIIKKQWLIAIVGSSFSIDYLFFSSMTSFMVKSQYPIATIESYVLRLLFRKR
jgi:hypothetical protein